MSTQPTGLVPEFDLSDRLRKARKVTGMDIREFATAIGVSHGTVSNAENGTRNVRKITLNAWALATGVSLEWLETGKTAHRPEPEGGSSVRQQGLEPRTRWSGANLPDLHVYPSIAAA